MMNKVIMAGRLTKDPVSNYFDSKNEEKRCIADFRIAVDRKFEKDKSDFFNCKAFGKTAEFIEKYLFKGIRVLIEGKIQNRSYENKDGIKVFVTEIIVDNVEIFDYKKKEENPNQLSVKEKLEKDGYINTDDITEENSDYLPF